MNALLVIDLQVGMMMGSHVPSDIESVVERVNSLNRVFRRNGDVTIFVRHDGDSGTPFAPNSKGWHLLPSLEVDDHDAIISKTACDSFCNSHLETWLQDYHVDHLYICGWATDFCVDTTIRSAASRGYRITVVSDGHTVANRDHLTAAQITDHHHRVWGDLIVPGEAIKIESTAGIIRELAPCPRPSRDLHS